MSDDELERLKARRLAEMQRNIADSKPPESAAPNPRGALVGRLGYRGLEVLENAERQYPAETRIITDQLGRLISSGEINEELDGGKLLMLFRSVGLYIRMKTKISVKQDGKLVSLAEKLGSGKK